MSLFGTTPKDPALRELERVNKQVRKDAERAQREAARAAEEERRRERDRIEREARKRRFDAFPEYIVREVREVTVKAANRSDAEELAKLAFKYGQDSINDDEYRISRVANRPWSLEGNTISKISRVALKVARFLD